MDIREALEAKMDEIESQDGAAPVPEAVETSTPSPEDVSAEPAPSSEETAEQKADRTRDEAGRFAKEPKQSKQAPKPTTSSAKPTTALPSVAAGVKGGVGLPVAGALPPSPVAKAPQFLRPGVREKFAGLPPDVQQDIYRLNTELVRVSKDAEQARKSAESASPWHDAIRPYEPLIRSSGMEPTKYVGDVLQTVHALSYGPPHQKAGLLANLVMQFGPDLLRPDQQDANGVPSCPLDRALLAAMQGRQGAAQPQAPQPQQFRDPRLDQLLERAQQRQEASAVQTTQSFAEGHEFYEDVKGQMADILDVWAKSGKTDVDDADLERAYTLACQLSPDVAPLVEQRKAAEAAQKAVASTARARSAASSPRSSPTAAPAAQPKGLRATLEAKADELGM